jgi:hypothetical protein
MSDDGEYADRVFRKVIGGHDGQENDIYRDGRVYVFQYHRDSHNLPA